MDYGYGIEVKLPGWADIILKDAVNTTRDYIEANPGNKVEAVKDIRDEFSIGLKYAMELYNYVVDLDALDAEDES